jgi:hypothetical protein
VYGSLIFSATFAISRDCPSASFAATYNTRGVPMPEDVPEPAVSSPAPVSEAESTEFVEHTDGENPDRLTEVVEDLSDNQVKIVSKIETLERRIQALEKPVAQPVHRLSFQLAVPF